MRKISNKKGFTLTEMVIVIAIIVILAGAVGAGIAIDIHRYKQWYAGLDSPGWEKGARLTVDNIFSGGLAGYRPGGAQPTTTVQASPSPTETSETSVTESSKETTRATDSTTTQTDATTTQATTTQATTQATTKAPQSGSSSGTNVTSNLGSPSVNRWGSSGGEISANLSALGSDYSSATISFDVSGNISSVGNLPQGASYSINGNHVSITINKLSWGWPYMGAQIIGSCDLNTMTNYEVTAK